MGRYAGQLSTVRPDDLAARAIEAAVERTGLSPEDVDDVYFGNANGAGEAREDQDAFAYESHRRAGDAEEAGRFDDELVTVESPQPKGDPVTIHSDEGPRPDIDMERLAKLRPVFREGGTVTAGNASPL